MGRPYPHISWWINTSHLLIDMPKYWSFWQWIQKVGATLIFEQQNCLVNGVPKIWNCSNFLNSLSKTSIHWYINYQVWCVSPPKEELVGPTHMGRTSPEVWMLYSVKMGENSFIFQWLYISQNHFQFRYIIDHYSYLHQPNGMPKKAKSLKLTFSEITYWFYWNNWRNF